jgi:hypothetical protein
MMLAPVHKEAAMVDVLRVREIAATVEPLVEGAADRGATGPAVLARPRGIVTVTDDMCDEAGGRHYSRTDVMRFRDGVLDHYAAAGILGDHLLDAAMELARLYRLARATMDVPGAALAKYGDQPGRKPAESQEQFEARVWTDFNRAVDHIPRGSQPACVDLARGLFPTGHDTVHHLLRGYSALATFWKMGPRVSA